MTEQDLEYKVHPYTEIFPLMTEKELLDLSIDIKDHGLELPILRLPDGRIIDGRNRFLACKRAGVTPIFKDLQTGGSAKVLLAKVVSLNLPRRHLTESQRGMVAAKIANIKFGDNQYLRKGTSTDVPIVSQTKAAEMLQVGKATVQRAKTVLTSGTPELQNAVESGAISVNAASRVAALPKKDQREIASFGDARKAAGALEKIRSQAPSAVVHLHACMLCGECRQVPLGKNDEDRKPLLHCRKKRFEATEQSNLPAINVYQNGTCDCPKADLDEDYFREVKTDCQIKMSTHLSASIIFPEKLLVKIYKHLPISPCKVYFKAEHLLWPERKSKSATKQGGCVVRR